METANPESNPPKVPLTVLWDPKILSPSRKFLPKSSALPPAKRTGVEFAA
jgi:hypothetical protein